LGARRRTTIGQEYRPIFSLDAEAVRGKNGSASKHPRIVQVTSNPNLRHHRHTRGFSRRFTAALLLATTFLPLLALRGQEVVKPIAWQTGPAFRQQLAASVSVSWEERPLLFALTSLAKSTQVAVFLDRRVDPEQPIDLEAADLPLSQVYRQLAAEADCGVAAVGSVVYLGPRSTTTKLSALAALRRQEAGATPAAARSKLLRSEAWQWEEATEPAQLLADLAQQGGVTVANPERLPHDLWGAGDFPPLAWAERMTLLLAGFELTFAFENGGETIRLEDMPASVVVEKTYTPKGDAADIAAQLRRILPEAKIRVEGKKLVVLAAEEDHDKAAQLIAGKTVRTVEAQPGEKRYTMEVKNQSIGAVVNTVATRLGKKLQYEAALTAKLRELTSFAVKDVTLEALMEKTLSPQGLTYKLNEETLEIVEK
jgi:hypothetical protein